MTDRNRPLYRYFTSIVRSTVFLVFPFIWPVNGAIAVAMSLFSELNPRNEFRVAIADLVAWWLLFSIVDVLGSILELPSSAGIVSGRNEVSSELALRLSEALGRCYLRRTGRSTVGTVHSEDGVAGRHN